MILKESLSTLYIILKLYSSSLLRAILSEFESCTLSVFSKRFCSKDGKNHDLRVFILVGQTPIILKIKTNLVTQPLIPNLVVPFGPTVSPPSENMNYTSVLELEVQDGCASRCQQLWLCTFEKLQKIGR